MDTNQHVRNTFVHFRQADGQDERGGPQSDSELLAGEPAVRGRRTPSPGPAPSPAPADSDPVGGEEERRGAKPGRRERKHMREAQVIHETDHPQQRPHLAAPASCKPCIAVSCYCCAFVAIFGLGFWSKGHGPYPMPEEKMTEHSVQLLKHSQAANVASLAVLEDKLRLNSMRYELDTQVFTMNRTAAKEMIAETCFLPERVCRGMVAAVAAREIKYHKKNSEPLNGNRGSYYTVGMWVQETRDGDEVQVAFMASSMTYQLQDVVTYKEQVFEEPVIKCEKTRWWFSTTETCREISRSKTVSQLPVFKQAVMGPQEMQLVDDMMEGVLAKKVLANTNHRVPLIGGRSEDDGFSKSGEF